MPDSRMYEAVKDDDLVGLRDYLSHNPHMLHDEDEGGYTILMEAARLGRLEIVQCLVDLGAKVDAYSEVIGGDRDERGTALAFALANFHRETAMFLIEKAKASVNTAYYLNEGEFTPYCEREHSTCFMYAMDTRDTEMLALMVGNGLRLNDVNAFCPKDDEEIPPLFYAIYEGKPIMVKWLMEQGASPSKAYEMSDFGTVDALMYAVLLGVSSKYKTEERYEIVEMLLEAGLVSQTVEDIIVSSGNERYISLLAFKAPATT